MTDFIGSLVFTYVGSDAYVTSPFTLDDYHTAHLLPDDTWNKFPTGFKYQAADGENTITIDLTSASTDAQVGGDYTAGIEDAIPDIVQTITSVVNPSGNWTTISSWDSNTVPTGAIVVIDVGDFITMDADGQIAYKTVISGDLLVGSTINQRLGIVSGSGTLTLESGSLPAGRYDDFFNCSTGGTMDFSGVGNYTLPNEIATIRNLSITGGGTKSLPNVDVVICGDLVLDDGAALENPQNRMITVQGDLILTNGIFNLGSNSTIVVNGSCTITAGALNLGNNSLTINGSLALNGGTINLGTNGVLDIDTDLTIAGGALNGTNASSVNVGDDITFSSGTFAVDATTTTVTLDGSGAQVITGDFTGTSAFNNLTCNSSGSISILDAGNEDVEVDGTLTLTLGDITTNSANTLTISSTGSISGGSSSSFVNGPLTRSSLGVGEDFTFQIGSGFEYALAGIENVGTGGQNWTAEFSGSNPNNGQTIDIVTNPQYGEMTGTTVNGSWVITSSGVNTATVVLGIQTHLDVQDLADVRVAIYDGPTPNEWVNLGGTTTGTESDGTVTSQSIANFSSRTFSLGGVGVSALPVELISFEGQVINSKVVLDWSTAQEINNDYFEIQRSMDGRNFETIGSINGSGNSDVKISYSFTDQLPYLGISYYRLNQIDFDGAFEYSKVILINNTSLRDGIEVTIFPNPTEGGNINLRILSGDENSPIDIRVMDLSGALYFHEQIKLTSLNMGYSITSLNMLPSGLYLIMVEQGGNITTQRVSIR